MMKQKVLIVEDEPSLLFAIHDYLDQQGYDVSAACEMEEASALLMNVPYDVVITDIRLSPLQATEGLQIIELMRERSLPARVIVLTGSSTLAIENKARHLRVDRYLHKPVALSIIARTVSELVTL
jgi:DNA-binding response OmpR family regulator